MSAAAPAGDFAPNLLAQQQKVKVANTVSSTFGVKHNAAAVGNEAAIDIEDGTAGPPWQVTDDAPNGQVKIQLGVSRGTGSVTFTAAQTSAGSTVTHNLGTTPTSIQITSTSRVDVIFAVSAVTSTQFTVTGFCAQGVITQSNSFDWAAFA